MKTAIFALSLMCCGCQDRSVVSEAIAPTAPSAAPVARDYLIDRVWMRVDGGDLPGRKLIFLGNGTLVQDSCWETYRLSAWHRDTANSVSWVEDTATVRAEVQKLTQNELVLKLLLPGEPQEQHFTVATPPFVCPDMKR